MMRELQKAKEYLKNGWSIIPLKPNSKEPLIPWKEYQQRYPTQKELETWFSNTQNGIGIVTGKISNLTVVDVDTLKPVAENIVSTVNVKTPKGRHWYFKYHEGITNAVRIKEDTDIRSEGGFVVAPPSRNYYWTNEYFRVSKLPEFPFHLFREEEKSNEAPRPRVRGKVNELLSNLRQGNRDSTFTSIIGLLHRDGYSPDDISAFLSHHAESVGFTELDKKINYITTRYDNAPRINCDLVHEQGPESVYDFLRDVVAPEWICEPVVARQSIVFVSGLPETMKTWITLDLAIEVARGGKWLNKFPVKKCRVLFIDQERHKSETQRRVRKLLIGKEIPSINDLYIQCGTTTRLNLDDSYSAFSNKLQTTRPDLVIVDSFATWHTENENDRQSIQTVLERIKQLRQDFNCTFLILDHENKSVFDPEAKGEIPNAFKQVGSVAKPAAAETCLTIRKVAENESIIYHTKSTLGASIEPVKVRVFDTADGGIKVEAI